MKRLIPFLTLVLVPSTAWAQGELLERGFETPPDYLAGIFTGPYFLVAIVAGLILAVAFQFVLTNLSVATGLSMVSAEGGGKGGGKGGGEKSHSSAGQTARKMTTGLGVWALITASIALFFASWLAVELSLAPNLLVGVVLGLTVWGLFYVVMTLFEASAISSLVGSLMGAARGGLKTAYATTTSMFSSSPDERAAEAATAATKAVKQEIMHAMGDKQLRDTLDKFVRDVGGKPMSAADIRKEMEKLIDHTEFRAVAAQEGLTDAEIDTMIADLHTEGVIEKSQTGTVAKGVKDAFNQFKQEQRSGKDRVTAGVDAAMKAAGKSDAEDTRRKVEQYLRGTHKSELNPEGIKRDLNKLFDDPKEGRKRLAERASHIDRSHVEALLAQRDDIDRTQASKVVDSVMQTFKSMGDSALNATASAQAEATHQQRTGEARKMTEKRLRAYFERTGQPELNYEGLKHDVQLLLHDPDAGLDALEARARSMDRETIMGVVRATPGIKEHQAERVVSAIEEGRDKALARGQEMKRKVERKVEEAKVEARHQAEEARKTASSAAWWAFATAIVSGVAAAIGGIVAVATGM